MSHCKLQLSAPQLWGVHEPLAYQESSSISCLSLLLCPRSESAESPEAAPSVGQAAEQPAVIPAQGDLLGDLLNLDLGPPVSGPPLAASSVQMGAVDLLGGGLDSLVGCLAGVWMRVGGLLLGAFCLGTSGLICSCSSL